MNKLNRGIKNQRFYGMSKRNIDLFELFSEDDKKRIISSVIFPRRMFFDCIDKVQTNRRSYTMRLIETEYRGKKIKIKRPYLGNVHERTFYTLFAIGHLCRAVDDNGKLKPMRTCYVDFYEFKKYAGFSPHTSWDFIKGIFEELRMAGFEIISGEKKLINVSHLIEAYSIEEEVSKNGKVKYTLYVLFSKDLLSVMSLSTFFHIPKEVIMDINRTFKESYVYRTVMYFMTQTKPLKVSLKSIVELLDDRNPYSDRKKRYKIRQKFKKHKENLKRYNIELLEEEDDIYLYFSGKLPFQFVGVKG